MIYKLGSITGRLYIAYHRPSRTSGVQCWVTGDTRVLLWDVVGQIRAVSESVMVEWYAIYSAQDDLTQSTANYMSHGMWERRPVMPLSFDEVQLSLYCDLNSLLWFHVIQPYAQFTWRGRNNEAFFPPPPLSQTQSHITSRWKDRPPNYINSYGELEGMLITFAPLIFKTFSALMWHLKDYPTAAFHLTGIHFMKSFPSENEVRPLLQRGLTSPEFPHCQGSRRTVDKRIGWLVFAAMSPPPRQYCMRL